jgi:hypothetical protein
MLPALPTPRPLRRVLAALLPAFALPLPRRLAGGGRPSRRPRAALLDALSLQIQLTQGAIARALDLDAVGLPQVSRVRVEEQQAVRIGEAPGLRLSGRFDWRLANDPIRVDSPFELYLQRGERGESWRLARPSGSTDGSLQEWILDPLPLPGQRAAG